MRDFLQQNRKKQRKCGQSKRLFGERWRGTRSSGAAYAVQIKALQIKARCGCASRAVAATRRKQPRDAASRASFSALSRRLRSVGSASSFSVGLRWVVAGCTYLMSGSVLVFAREGVSELAAPRSLRSCAIGCLMDLDATPARMMFFVNVDPIGGTLPFERAPDQPLVPSVCMLHHESMHSNAV